MAIRPILHLPDPRLRQVAVPVTEFDDALQVLINDMFETMYDARGVGLAATQIGVGLRLTVIDVTAEGGQPLVLINPEILEAEGKEMYQEGCLSVPGIYEKVERASRVRFRALDRTGQPFEMTAEGLLGECVQHEIDHLNGQLFIDLLSPLKRSIARRKFDKVQRANAKKL